MGAVSKSPTPTPSPTPLQVRHLGLCEYEPIWRRMQQFTQERTAQTPDELWLLQHPPVFTQGLNGAPEHLLGAGDIPVVDIDRGGQVTYHGPGQLVVYPLIDLRRHKLGIRALVTALEQSVIAALAGWDILAQTWPRAPGVYVGDSKVASVGLRVRRGCSYHGLAFNVDMDLEPFSRINPCGFRGLKVTQVKDLGGPGDIAIVANALQAQLLSQLGYNTA